MNVIIIVNVDFETTESFNFQNEHREFHFVLMLNVKISADNDISFYHWHLRMFPECLQKLLGLRSVIELTVMSCS